MQEIWDGKETGLPYFFPRNDLQPQVCDDLWAWFRCLAGDGWLQENVAEFLIDPSRVCMLSVMKAISQHYPETEQVYMKYIRAMKQTYARDEIVPVLSEVAEAAGIEILVYLPETSRWCVIGGSIRTARCKLVVTHNSIYAGWSGELTTEPLGDVHLSDWQRAYMSMASSILNEMFQVKVYRSGGLYHLEGNVSRTASEAAQRVLLHALQACRLTAHFPYRIDQKKKFTGCIDRYELIWNTLDTSSMVPVFPDCRPESAKTSCTISSSLPWKMEKVAAIKEKIENWQMGIEDTYARGLREWEKEAPLRHTIAWREVMREIEARQSINFSDRIAVAEAYRPPLDYRGLMTVYEEKRDIYRRYLKEKIQDPAKLLMPELMRDRPTWKGSAIRSMARGIIEKQHPEVVAELERLKLEAKVALEEAEEYDESKITGPTETVAEIKHQLEVEMRARRAESPRHRVTWVEDPEYAEKLARLQELRNISKKSRELGLELVACQKFVKENEPGREYIREKPHKVIPRRKPLLPISSNYITEGYERDIEIIMSKPDKAVTKKEAVRRDENRISLVAEVSGLPETRKVHCPNLALKMRNKLLMAAKRGRHRKIDHVWKGIKTVRPVQHMPVGYLPKDDPIMPRLGVIAAASAMSQLVDSARRDLNHSGARPSIKSLAMTNDEASALASLSLNNTSRKFLRMFLPNNISNKICSHRGSLINQRFH